MSVNKYLRFKDAYANQLICYCALWGLGSRPVIATGDKNNSGENYNIKNNIKMLNDVNFLGHF